MNLTMREAFGAKLAELGKTRNEIVVLDADVSSSTKSALFGKAFPERFFNCGVAEANMVGVAAGLATAGHHPVVNAFSIFLALKATDQIRNAICYNRLPVILAGAYGGLSDSFDGASHQSIADIAIMRALPNMEVIVPSDSAQAEQALEYALERNGPVYIRLNRNALPDLGSFPASSLTSARILREGTDITIAANGITAAMCLDAANVLSGRGFSAEVLSVPSVKPLDATGIAASVQKTGRILTVEEHNIIGGFGGACAEALMRLGVHCAFDSVGIEDVFTETGPYDELLAAYGLSAPAIAERAEKLCR
ncbi:transketolase family protein [Treponema sp.]